MAVMFLLLTLVFMATSFRFHHMDMIVWPNLKQPFIGWSTWVDLCATCVQQN